MNKFKMVATCMLGIEGLLANELRFMGAENVTAENGRVFFEGDEHILVRANIKSRLAERILIVMGIFKAFSFDELFEKTKALEWDILIGKNDKFPVAGRSLDSKLTSIPDCQKIIKKAIVEKMKQKYNIQIFPETGSTYQVRFLILKNSVILMIDTSGTGLHKRGYRENANDAPIKETLAAALVELSKVRSSHTVYDPMCGSGTILIEAAMKAMNIAPGLNRKFAFDDWKNIDKAVISSERQTAHADIRTDCEFIGFGSDIDKFALRTAIENAEKAGVKDKLRFEKKDIKDFVASNEYATVICNPPYGERLLTASEATKIYKTMGNVFIPKPHHSYTIITPEDSFEQLFGRKADKRRKLYNGTIPCQVYMYFR